MPSLRKRSQQPSPVTPQAELPPEFPPIPQEVLDRFPAAVQWQEQLAEFWTRTKQSLNQAQTQAANYANARVVYSVDQFLIYAKNGIPEPMFALDSTGVKLGNVLVVNTAGRKVYIGAGSYNNAETPFYVDTDGFFSLGDQLTWNPETATLSVTGTFIISGGTIGGFDIGTDYIRDTANSMGLASTVTGGDDVRFWSGDTFANRATAPFRVTEAGNITANNATIIGTISGRSTTTIAAAIDSSGSLVTDLINARLNTSAKTMLSDFTFGAADYAGALKSGTVTWNTTTGAITGGSGVLVYRGGIIGAASGVATFTVDATTGAATFAGALSAPTGNIGGWTIGASTLSGGNATLNSGGTLSLGTSNDIVILSATDGTYRLWVGNATAASAAFSVTKAGVLTATGATITGTITATTGAIGGFNIGSDYIRDAANSMGLASTVTGSDDVRFWAGDTFANRASAPFSVTEAGVLRASSAVITGVLTTTSGAIGGFGVASDYLRDDANSFGFASTITGGDDIRIWAGSTFANRTTAPFRVYESGAIVGTSATITGTITANAGAIGGFDIGSDYLRDTANSFGLTSTVTGGDDVRLWAGSTFASRATAPFRVTEAGALVASSATITGTITSSSGTIGGFTLSSTAITAGSGSSKVELASDVSGKPDNSALILGITSSLNYYTYLGRGGLSMTYAAAAVGDDYYGVRLYVDSGTNGCGVLELSRNTASASRLTLEGNGGTIVAEGAIRSNDKFNHNGTDGITDTIVIGVNTITVSGGIITNWA